jgi:hypothetical protein
VLLSVAVLPSPSCSLDMTLDEVSLLVASAATRRKLVFVPSGHSLCSMPAQQYEHGEVACRWSRHGQIVDSCSTA